LSSRAGWIPNTDRATLLVSVLLWAGSSVLSIFCYKTRHGRPDHLAHRDVVPHRELLNLIVDVLGQARAYRMRTLTGKERRPTWAWLAHRTPVARKRRSCQSIDGRFGAFEKACSDRTATSVSG
jgi:hypothetical protein